MPTGNGKKSRSPKPNAAPLARAARNAAFAAAVMLDAHQAENKGDRDMAIKRGQSAVQWLKEALREIQDWLEHADGK